MRRLVEADSSALPAGLLDRPFDGRVCGVMFRPEARFSVLLITLALGETTDWLKPVARRRLKPPDESVIATRCPAVQRLV